MEAAASARMPLRAVPDGDWRDSLLPGARAIANAMGLRDWDVTILDESPANGAQADVVVAENRRHISIRLCESFPELPEEEQRHSFVHEFVHVHLTRATASVYEDVRPELGAATWRFFWNGYVRDVECAVDALAEILTPTMPQLR